MEITHLFYESLNLVSVGDWTRFYQGTHTIVLFSIFQKIAQNRIIQGVKTKHSFNYNENKANIYEWSEKNSSFSWY